LVVDHKSKSMSGVQSLNGASNFALIHPDKTFSQYLFSLKWSSSQTHTKM
jgi:hypothetical protein